MKKNRITNSDNLIIALLITTLFAFLFVPRAEGFILAQKKDVNRLKHDLRAGKLPLGETTLMDIRKNYGDAGAITHQETACTYAYPGLTITFTKNKLLKKWDMDRTQRPSLPAIETEISIALGTTYIAGYTTLKNITDDYGNPTQVKKRLRESPSDNYDLIIAYYGQLRIFFEQRIVMATWAAKNLPGQQAKGILTEDDKAIGVLTVGEEEKPEEKEETEEE